MDKKMRLLFYIYFIFNFIKQPRGKKKPHQNQSMDRLRQEKQGPLVAQLQLGGPFCAGRGVNAAQHDSHTYTVFLFPPATIS
jgi:hypothetical protein